MQLQSGRVEPVECPSLQIADADDSTIDGWKNPSKDTSRASRQRPCCEYVFSVF